ncbi:MAG: MopE-related protein [Myxococcota bacterium]|nr:MopE-related protein [Myxococcota bacterium]
MRYFLVLGLISLTSCDDHKFTGGGHSEDVDLSGDSYGTVLEIMSASCIGCHSNASASGGLSLEGDICSTTIGVVSPTYGETLIVPGDHEASVFWHKCADTGSYGQEMPIGSPLPADQAAVIAQWIDEGASCEAPTIDTGAPSEIDADGDGYGVSEDCDDDDAMINPGADEIWYDGIDQNCDGASDYDADGDGYESDDYAGTDCNDTSADSDEDGESDGFAINPGADEIWYDGIDQNCDQASDFDQDGDGQDSDQYGGQDCDDENNTIYNGAYEFAGVGFDEDCYCSDLVVFDDADYDGYDNTVDCNDSDDSVNPGAAESTTANGIDDNCDGDIDEATTAFDDDGDCYCEEGYNGNCTGSADSSCGTLQVGDCNDSSAAAYPSASEGLYDNFDSDCDGADYAYDLSDGEAHFNSYCATGCHAAYAPSFASVVPSFSAAEIYNIITNGSGSMQPQLSGDLQSEQARVNTAEYVWQTYQ